jgi:hypothetical protein
VVERFVYKPKNALSLLPKLGMRANRTATTIPMTPIIIAEA